MRISVVFYLLLSVSSLTAQERLRVYVFVAEECPISIAMADPLDEVSTDYSERVDFIAVFPNLKSDDISIRAFLGRHGLDNFSPQLDPDQALARQLGAKVTPEVVVTNEASEVLYRGRITDAYAAPGKVRHGNYRNDLAEVLPLLLTGRNAPRPWPEAVGCFITFLPVNTDGK